jgi:hypothetical protein
MTPDSIRRVCQRLTIGLLWLPAAVFWRAALQTTLDNQRTGHDRR